MIRCVRCGKEFDGGATMVVCDRCGERLPQSAEVHDEAVPDYGTIRAFLSPEAPAAPVPPVASPPAAPPSAGTPGEVESAPAPLDAHHLETIADYRKGKSLIAVVGFGGSGKTFFVNRLRDQLPRGPWKCSRRPAREIPASPEGLELTRFVPTRGGRQVPRGAGGQDHSYTVIDCAGESLVQAIERQQETESLDAVTARSYLAALAMASAYVLVVRAEDLLAAEHDESRRRLGGVVGDFYTIIHAIVVAKERLARREPAESLIERGISREELAAVFDRSRTRCREPICVSFSQADRLERLPEADGDYDADPYLYAVRHARRLWHAVRQCFIYYRFDFMSSFYRLDTQSGGDTIRPDYGLPSYGAVDTFAWLDGMLSPPPRLAGRARRLASGRLPTGYAVALRRLIDRRFRAELAR